MIIFSIKFGEIVTFLILMKLKYYLNFYLIQKLLNFYINELKKLLNLNKIKFFFKKKLIFLFKIDSKIIYYKGKQIP